MAPIIRPYSTIFDVANAAQTPGKLHEAFHRIYQTTQGVGTALASPQLVTKYNVDAHSDQRVLCVRDRVRNTAAWYNEQRSRKPQTFEGPVQGGVTAQAFDSTGPQKPCDFCNWETLTAEDPFGRIHGVHSVTASNLFKYCQPAHGLVLWKHHQPLDFTLEQLGDLLTTAQGWFEAASSRYPTAQHPLLIWNVLHRAGASQYHGHAQVLLSEAPFPTPAEHAAAAAQYHTQYNTSYYDDMLTVADSLGLLACVQYAPETQHTYTLHTPDTQHTPGTPAGTPPAGMSNTTSGCTAIKDSGRDASKSNNAAPRTDTTHPAHYSPSTPPLYTNTLHSTKHNHPIAWITPSLSPCKDMEVVITAPPGSSLACPAFHGAMYCVLRALIDRLRVSTYNLAVYNVPCGDLQGGPLLARVVSRGKLDTLASDFGGLEVFGGASIAATDPYTVMDAIHAQIQHTVSQVRSV